LSRQAELQRGPTIGDSRGLFAEFRQLPGGLKLPPLIVGQFGR
jgi:hypothetical protein